jgi:predicted DNA-binding protein
MATLKKRLNITLPKEARVYLKKLAMVDQVPEATKAAELLQMALEIQEDAYFSTVADERLKKSKKSISHKEFWSKVL